MRRELTYAIRFTLIGMVVFGAVYHAAIWAVANSVFADQAGGSLIYRADGSIVGSRVIAQPFTGDRYFTPRPSAVDYNAASTGGSNHGTSNPEHLQAVADRVAAVVAREGVTPGAIPAALVTASGAGLDPDLPVEAILLQVPRVARARGVEEARIRQIVASHITGRWLGLFGAARINVLELNLALDRMPHGQPEGE